MATTRIAPSSSRPGAPDGGQVDAQPGHHEIDREQDQYADLYEALEDFLAQPQDVLAWHDDAEQERAEDEVQAHPVGGVAGQQQPGQHGGQDVRGESARLQVEPGQPTQQRPDDTEHRGRVRDREQHLPLCAAPGQGDHHGQQDPGQHVRDRRAGQRDAADTGPVQAPVGEDASQDGERGGGHRGADEQREGGHVVQVVAVGQPHAQRRSQGQGQEDRSGGHTHRDPLAAPDEAQVHLVPDHEHEQDQADVGQRGQRRDQAGREQHLGDRAVEERGPQQDPGQDLAQHRGLAQELGCGTEQPGQDDDERHVRQQQLDIA